MNDYDVLFDALEFAVKAHRGQFRKGTFIPYATHPIKVAEILINSGCPAYIAAAGALHDTVEDTDITIEDIETAFGPAIANIVKDATQPEAGDSWEARKTRTVDSVRNAPVDSLLVECADKLDNIISIRKAYDEIGDEIWSRFYRGRESQKWYYKALAAAFAERLSTEPGKSLIKKFIAEVDAFFGGC